MEYTSLFRGAFLGAFLIGSAAVSAAPVTLQVCTDASCWNGGYDITEGVVVNWSDVQTLDNTAGKSVDDWETAQGLDVSAWSLSMDTDPFVTNNFTVTNNTGSTQVYSLTATIGVAPPIPNGLMRGSIGFSLTDNNGDGATLATSGASSLYRGLIDGNTARTLWDAPISFTAPFATINGNDNFGFPVRETAPDPVNSDIGIAILFSLTAGDSVGFTSNFDVVPVPVPAAAWLFGSGLLVLSGVTRRRRRS